ncbi:CHAP domain-containing protein [Catellatospora methionotrophica]|uniref:CHAP domain-containing protein n=1 Tax=Catellatospora methionotrophica TaxID=121620 RepID=UPI00140E4E27|nr:CHAP domain-containing protein [Catellatospora methionotrophica]
MAASALVVLATAIGSLLLALPASATTTFGNDYPDLDASPCGWSDWCKGGTDMSSRGYVFRNCTDGAAYWVMKYTGVSVSGWGNARNWDNAAAAAGHTVKASTSDGIEPGDLAQSEGPTSYGHVGFVAKVNKSATGNVTSVEVAELNGSVDANGNPTGQYRYQTYAPGAWDHYIDVNGPNKGLGNETITRTLHTGVAYDESTGLTQVFSVDEDNTLRETYWLWGQTPATITVALNATLTGRAVDVSAVVANGWRHVYIATDAGHVYETVWQAGSAATTRRINPTATIPGLVGITATHDAGSGLTQVFSVDAGRNVRETYWLWNQTPATVLTTQLGGGTPTSISAVLHNGYRHVYVATREGWITETRWSPGVSSLASRLIAEVPGTVGVTAARSGLVMEVFTVQPDGTVKETYWQAFTAGPNGTVNAAVWPAGQPPTIAVKTLGGAPSDISSFVTANGWRHVFVANGADPHTATENVWTPGGGGVSTWSPVWF